VLTVTHSTVRAIPQVVAARSWASGDLARLELVRVAVSGLTRRLYAASSDVLNGAALLTPAKPFAKQTTPASR
jgi:hypothetical protein